MDSERQAVCDLATTVLGSGLLRMLGEGRYFWIATRGAQTALGWDLREAMRTLRSLADSGNPAAAAGSPPGAA